MVKEILEEWGHEHELEAIDAYLPLVDEYYEDRYREDDTFWTDEDEASQVWVGMYSLLCRKLGIDEDAEAIARRVYEEFGDPRAVEALRRRVAGARAPRGAGHLPRHHLELGQPPVGLHRRPRHRREARDGRLICRGRPPQA